MRSALTQKQQDEITLARIARFRNNDTTNKEIIIDQIALARAVDVMNQLVDLGVPRPKIYLTDEGNPELSWDNLMLHVEFEDNGQNVAILVQEYNNILGEIYDMPIIDQNVTAIAIKLTQLYHSQVEHFRCGDIVIVDAEKKAAFFDSFYK